MDLQPPTGSEIIVDRDIHSTTYIWQNGKKNIGQYGIAIFLLFWLCGWTVGGITAATHLFTNDDTPLSGKLFMLFWLGGWAFGEVAVIYTLYNIFRPLQPAKLALSSRTIEYETGTKSFNFNNYNRSQSKPKLFQRMRNKSYRMELDSDVNLQLQWIGERQRLSFDVGTERVEIGESLSEPDREWLYDVLMSHMG